MSSSSCECSVGPTPVLTAAAATATTRATPPLPYFANIPIIIHSLIFLFVLSNVLKYIRREFKQAKGNWQQAMEVNQISKEEDKHGFEIEDGNGAEAPELGELVVNADLGKGEVVDNEALIGERGYQKIATGLVHVFFESINETRPIDVKSLIRIGSRVRHPKRGFGTVLEFDDRDRVHVDFDNGEFHRYKYDSWKKKMVSSRSKIRFDRSFTSFVYDYLLYRTDYLFSTYTLAKPLVLLLTTYFIIVVGAVAYSMTSGTEASESMWIAWTMIVDSGAHADETGTVVRMVALLLTLCGMLVFALMISIIADGVSSLLDSLKQGNSHVIETGHTLILGWSDKTLPMINEIALANESMGGGVVVVLADRPKSEMEQDLLNDFLESHGTLVICRSGSPLNQSDLRKVSAGAAKSVVVLADNKIEPDESDARVVRCILSLLAFRNPKMGHVVVEMCDIDNRDLAYLADPNNVEVVVAHDLIGRLMIQCAREPGLAQILEELLGFEGDEFYLKSWPGVFEPGTTFGEVLFRFEDAVPLGIKPFDRRDAYEQIRDSKWRRESLNRRGRDGEIVNAASSSFSTPRMSSFQQRHADNFALRQEDADAPVMDHFAAVEEEVEAHSIRTNALKISQTAQKSSSRSLQSDFDDDNLSLFSEENYDGEKLSRAVIINPPNDYILREKDEVLVIAEDDDSYKPKSWSLLPKSAKNGFDSMHDAHRPTVQARSERFLFCGWRRDIDDIVNELDKLVGKGSELTILCSTPVSVREEMFIEGGLDVNKLKNIKLKHELGNPILRRDLNRLSSSLNTFGSILILADQAFETNVSTTDSRSLASLLLIRDMILKKNRRMVRFGSAPSPSSHFNGSVAASAAFIGGNSTTATSTTNGANGVHGVGRLEMLEKATSFSDNESTTPRELMSGHPFWGANSSAAPFLSISSRQLSFQDNDLDPGPLPVLGAVATAHNGGFSPLMQRPAPLERRPSMAFSQSFSHRSSTLSGAGGGFGGSRRQMNSAVPSDYFVHRPSAVGAALFFENAHNTGNTVLISEILDSRTKALIPSAMDHVMSNEVVASVLAMVSECREISVVLSELLQADGNDLHLRSAIDYGLLGEKIDFWTLQARARERGEIAIGYRFPGDKVPTLNPREKCALITLSPRGTVIVISED